MRILFLAVCVLFFMFWSCQNTNHTDSSSAASQPKYAGQDSARMLVIKAYVDSINAHRKDFERLNVNPKFSSEDDKLLAFKNGDEIVLARLDEVKEDAETREYFFRKDNKIVNYQLLYWSKKTMPPYGWGINIFLDDKGVAFAEERYLELSTDERPARLLTMPPMAPKVNVDSIVRVAYQRWQPIKKALEKP